MRFGIYKSIGLSSATRVALRTAGGIISRGDRTVDELPAWCHRNELRCLFNYGNSTFPEVPEIPVFNAGKIVTYALTPGRHRKVFGDLAPPESSLDYIDENVWVKGPGYGGRNKYKGEFTRTITNMSEWDVQKHIEGEEYRINTVGNLIVQAHKRRPDVDGQRTYEWVGTAASPSQVRSIARLAAKRYTDTFETQRHFTALDIIFDGEAAFLLEVNTSPGVNEATAVRIRDAAERILNEE